jgi:hypothetical protein
MTDELLRPIDADTAHAIEATGHAIEETAKTASKAIDAAADAGKYVSGVLGSSPATLVGVLGADWLYHWRVRNWAKFTAKTREHLERWGCKEPFEDPTPALAVPIIQAAFDEDRDELKDLWARLLASAMHPDRKNRVRLSFIATLKQLDPLDALCLRAIGEGKSNGAVDWHPVLIARFASSADEIQVSLEKLVELQLLKIVGHHRLSPLGRLFLAAVED